MSDYCELKKRAMDATPGPWYEQDDEDSAAGAVFVMPESDVWMPPICRITTEANAAYVAAANPAAILELIAENESLRKDAERYRAISEYFVSEREDMDDDLIDGSDTLENLASVVDRLNRSPENH